MEADNEWLIFPSPFFVLCIMWLTFRVPVAMSVEVAFGFYSWLTVLVSLVHSAECCSFWWPHRVWPALEKPGLWKNGNHGIKTICACPERVFSKSCRQAHAPCWREKLGSSEGWSCEVLVQYHFKLQHRYLRSRQVAGESKHLVW